MELAGELGRAIKDDSRIKDMNAAREAFEGNQEIQTLIAEYNTQRAALGEEYKKETPDEALIEAINNRIDALYEKITEDPIFVAYNSTQAVVNEFMNEVNSEITFQITGERPCTHDCSSCHGGCGHDHEH